MQSYRIGRIEGRWQNFVPPIQGGKFHKLDAGDTAQIDPSTESTADSTSEETSSTSSPDIAAEDTQLLRQRKGALPTPPSSVASDDSSHSKPRMSHMDRRTQQEIDFDISIYPSLDPEVQDNIIRKYRELHVRIKSQGLFQCDYWNYAREAIRYVIFFALSMYFLRLKWYMASAVFLGIFWHQLTFIAHDAGHMGITHNFHIDTCIGIFVANFLGGLSIGWWKKNHNVHHIVTNAPEHDPDIQHLPFFAVSHRFLDSLRSTYYNFVMEYDIVARTTVRLQHHLYYVILAFGRFNLYRLSWTYLILRQAPRKGPAWWHYWLEVVGTIFFWTWFGYGILYKCVPSNGLRLAYLLVSHVVTSPVHVQITLSHFGMSTADLGPKESFAQKMMRTTMDVDCPPWLDFIHGGLQFQAIHHLYPRIPRHNLRRAQHLVQEFCEEVNIPYAIYGFVEGNKQVIGRLEDVARQAKIFAACQQAMVAEGDLGTH